MECVTAENDLHLKALVFPRFESVFYEAAMGGLEMFPPYGKQTLASCRLPDVINHKVIPGAYKFRDVN